jgi:hypothetical protein
MSSFLVEDRTINIVVEYLASGGEMGYLRNKIKRDLCIDLETYEGKKKLGEYMFKMNCKATGQRYSESEGIGLEDFRPLNYKYELVVPNQYQALKSLSCWLYQCAEGEVYGSDEYEVFEEIRGDIAYHIVSNMKEYEDAKWG